MKTTLGMISAALVSAAVACGTPTAESTIGISHTRGVERYATVRDLVHGAEQHQPREQLLAGAAP